MSDAMTHDAIRELLPLYVLGALQGAGECEVVCGHLATGCLGCTDELSRLARASAAIGGTLAAVSPSAAMRERLEKALQKQAREQAPERMPDNVRSIGARGAHLPRWAFSVAAAIAIAASAYALSQGDELRRERDQRWGLEKYVVRLEDRQQQLQRDSSAGREALAQIAAGDSTVFSITSADGSMAGTGRIVWNRKAHQWTLVAQDLPPLPEDKAYELWFITADQKEAIAGGKFRPDESGLVRFTSPLPPGREDLVIGAVTLEPAIESAEDAAKPAGKPFLVGKAKA